jgi:hypothetical protein
MDLHRVPDRSGLSIRETVIEQHVWISLDGWLRTFHADLGCWLHWLRHSCRLVSVSYFCTMLASAQALSRG